MNAQVKIIGTGGGVMTRCTNFFAHFALVSACAIISKRRPANGLQNVTVNFNSQVKLLLNWKSGLLTGLKSFALWAKYSWY